MQFRKVVLGIVLSMTAIAGVQSAVAASTRYDFIAEQIGLQKVAVQSQTVQFKVRIENISATNAFTASNGTNWTLDFSPGVWLVHRGSNTLFAVGQKDLGAGLETIAEDGNPTRLAQALKTKREIVSSGIFNTPVGATAAKGIRPGQVFEFTVNAAPGEKLSFATMFGQSNDWFYAPNGSGIDLFDTSGKPIRGDITAQIYLWNDGTEEDEEPGIGANQGPRQKAPNTGVEENGVVQQINNDAAYGKTSQVMRVTVMPE
jgi:hypothetical protein